MIGCPMRSHSINAYKLVYKPINWFVISDMSPMNHGPIGQIPPAKPAMTGELSLTQRASSGSNPSNSGAVPGAVESDLDACPVED